ncbi:glycosyltransferase [Solirubrobacter taibaiensis]|nr:glycosyltransferase [Solirubrobacter taibaiensis]
MSRRDADIVFVGDRCCDHSSSSGYDQLCRLFPDAGWLSGQALANGVERWHRRLEVPSPRIAHVIYGDCSGKHLFAPVRERFPEATIVATLHQPVARLLRDPAAAESLEAADALFTVSRRQARELAALGITTSALPHGVWTRAFRPSRPPEELRRTALLVGNYLRDWPAIRRIVQRLHRAGADTVLVGTNAPRETFVDDPAVSVCPRLSEDALARVYDGAAALLMVVRDATASNAVLESMAAGCPVVFNESPALVEYVGDTIDAFANEEEAVMRVLHYADDVRARSARSEVLMDRAERFDWARLAGRYRRAYDAQRPALAIS